METGSYTEKVINEINEDPFPGPLVKLLIPEVGKEVFVYRKPKCHSSCNGKGYTVRSLPKEKYTDKEGNPVVMIDYCSCTMPSKEQEKILRAWYDRHPKEAAEDMVRTMTKPGK